MSEPIPKVEESQDFLPRDYQILLLERAVHENIIVYLPTGSGKTFIASMLIRRLSKAVEKPFKEGGQRTFFLVNTVALVNQQARCIKEQTPLTVSEYSGDMGVDYWDEEKWLQELENNQVLVMTAQIFLNLLLHNYINISVVNLLIMDECHHAVSNHAMALIMKQYHEAPSTEMKPRILGLTATLLNSSCKPDKIREEIKQLELTLDSKVAQADSCLVYSFATNPNERIIMYDGTDDFDGFLIRFNQDLSALLKSCQPHISQVPIPGASNLDAPKSWKKILKNWISSLTNIKENCGLYGFSRALIALVIRVERIKLARAIHQEVVLMLDSFTSCLHRLKHRIERELAKVHVSKQIYEYSSNKFRELFKIIEKLGKNDLCLVFVEQRLTAQTLYYIFKELSTNHENFKNICPEFIVGNNTSLIRDTRETLYTHKKNHETLEKFNNSTINVLFASDVIEEGIDVKVCNYVVKFDFPKTFRSYIQSKGRARHEQSQFLLFCPKNNGKSLALYYQFQLIEKLLESKLHDAENSSPEISQEEAELRQFKTYMPYGIEGPKVTPTHAVSLLNRYCSLLPHDMFTSLSPSWWVKPAAQEKFIVILQLPVNSPIKDYIESPPCFSKVNAKRWVALEACIRLHQANEFDSKLIPRGCQSELLNDSELFQHWREVDDSPFKPGSRKCRRTYHKAYPSWLCQSRPRPNVGLFLHIISITPKDQQPTETSTSSKVYHRLLSSDNCYGILCSKPLPKICEFSVFMRIGEIKVRLQENAQSNFQLNEDQLHLLFRFHCFLFSEVLPVASKFCVKDFGNEENAYFVVPIKGSPSRIDWDAVNNYSTLPPVISPSDEDKMNLNVTDETYLEKVIMPWYKDEGRGIRYIVTRVCSDLSPKSPFPSENFKSYEEYFLKRYDQKVLNRTQALIEVRAVSSKSNCLRPRGKRRRKRKHDDDMEETLIPELCVVLDFPSVYLLKATLLPAILHRIHYLLLAEELRRKIASETGLGPLVMDQEWNSLEVDDKVVDVDDEPAPQGTIDVSDLITSGLKALEQSSVPWQGEIEPLNIEKDISNVDLLSVMHYEKFFSASSPSVNSNSTIHRLSSPKTVEKFIPAVAPPLDILQPKPNTGPQLCDMLTAITGSKACDIINYERLETLGDSFLKLAVSLVLFTIYEDKDEGKLTTIKGKIIGNRNLFYIGERMKLGEILKVFDFDYSEWDVPMFRVPHLITSLIRDEKLNPSILYQLNPTQEERDLGICSEETFLKFLELSYVMETSELSHASSAKVGLQSVSDKTIADAIEALIGLYLGCGGVESAFKLCQWFGIISEKLADMDKILKSRPGTALLRGTVNINSLLIEPDKLERTLGYKFNDRSFLLQALSHTSFFNNATDCYQRLEFLGDAVLDFLVTSYIYENCGNLTPGELTDLRSALVNNVTFACLVVRNKLHTYMNFLAPKLSEVVMKFARHQEDRGHAIGSEVLFLVMEEDVYIAESVHVPKVLGDLFESLAAAVYLDSGKNLQKVWDVFYNLMRQEIESFSKNVPKNVIRLLYEKFPSPAPVFGKTSTVVDSSRMMIALQVIHNGKPMVFNGLGENKSLAKIAAAKLALRHYH